MFLCTSGVAAPAAAYFAGIPQRSGVGGGAGLLLTGRVKPRRAENQAETWLRLAEVAGVHQQLHSPVFEPGPEARRRAEQVLHGTGLGDGRLLVAIAPGSGYAESHAAPVAATVWDPERWAHLANLLAQRHGAGILIVGSPHDRYAADRTKIDLRAAATDLVGEIDLATLAGVVARCDLLVGSDTPLLQLAAAMGTPTVRWLFEDPTDGARGGAYGPAHRVIQALATSPFRGRRRHPGEHGPDPRGGRARRHRGDALSFALPDVHEGALEHVEVVKRVARSTHRAEMRLAVAMDLDPRGCRDGAVEPLEAGAAPAEQDALAPDVAHQSRRGVVEDGDERRQDRSHVSFEARVHLRSR